MAMHFMAAYNFIGMLSCMDVFFCAATLVLLYYLQGKLEFAKWQAPLQFAKWQPRNLISLYTEVIKGNSQHYTLC